MDTNDVDMGLDSLLNIKIEDMSDEGNRISFAFILRISKKSQ